MFKKREKRHISSLACFTSLASVDGSTFFLNVNVCLLRENIPEKTFFYIIFISSSFVNKPKVSFSNPFGFRHSTKIIFYQKTHFSLAMRKRHIKFENFWQFFTLNYFKKKSVIKQSKKVFK